MGRILRANPGPAHWSHRTDGGTFRPYGPLVYVGRLPRKNPETWSLRTTWAARLFVGLSVGNEPTWSVDDVIGSVRNIRKAQGEKPDASFVLQRGIYQHRRGGKVVQEESVQVILVDTEQTPPKRFRKQMVGLAERLAARLRQELIVVEIQRNGVTKETIGVEP